MLYRVVCVVQGSVCCTGWCVLNREVQDREVCCTGWSELYIYTGWCVLCKVV